MFRTDSGALTLDRLFHRRIHSLAAEERVRWHSPTLARRPIKFLGERYSRGFISFRGAGVVFENSCDQGIDLAHWPQPLVSAMESITGERRRIVR